MMNSDVRPTPRMLDTLARVHAERDEPEELANVCSELNIRAHCLRSSKPAPEWMMRGSHAYKVTLTYGKRRLTVDFYQGPACTTEPSPADVLSCLTSDVRVGEQSFEDFASDVGLDTDSRKAEQTWKACRRMAPKVRRFLGDSFERVSMAQH